jgi:hypothetical protein
MRIIEEITLAGGKLTIFKWNQKYLLKYETGDLEQVYKVPETEVANFEDLKAAATGNMLLKVKQHFAAMDATLDGLYEQL